ncbi:MAG: cytochrome b/b6 domain-containing protein [Verrucomicrobiota bacterium]
MNTTFHKESTPRGGFASGTFLIWDLPTRLFHWLLTAGFIAAALLAFLSGEKSRLFPYHAVIGLALTLLVVLRMIWGLMGTRYARFTAFLFGPRAVLVYLKEAFTGGGLRHLGHTPGSAYAIFAMLALMLGISITGILLSRGHEAFKEAHEVMSFAMIAVVVAHVIGVAFHSIRHRENITLSMVNGRKVCDPAHGIAAARPIVAIVFLGLLSAWTFGVVKNYDATTKTTTLPLFGASLQLGESGTTGKQGKHPGGHERKQDHD